MQRYSVSTQQPERDALGEWVKLSDVRTLFEEILDDASTCSSAGSMMVTTALLESVADRLGITLEW